MWVRSDKPRSISVAWSSSTGLPKMRSSMATTVSTPSTHRSRKERQTPSGARPLAPRLGGAGAAVDDEGETIVAYLL